MLNKCEDFTKRTANRTAHIIFEQPLEASESEAEPSTDKSYMNILPSIRINDERMMVYRPLNESNRAHIFNSTCRYGKNIKTGKLEAEDKMKKSTSIQTLKKVHSTMFQINSFNPRIKTETDKQNELLPFFPKNYRQSKMKKENAVKQTNQSKCQDKREHSTSRDLPQPSSRSLAQKISKGKSISHLNSQRQEPRENAQILDILSSMFKKQQNITESKSKYEQRIKELKTKILQEQNLLSMSNKRQQKMMNNLNLKDQTEKQLANESILSLKKRENIQHQAKELSRQVMQATSHNTKLTSQIQEEKEIISNYLTVIEELKQQLKQQTQDKLQLQKKLSILKKSQKIQATKKANQAKTTEQLMHTIYSSLEKWK